MKIKLWPKYLLAYLLWVTLLLFGFLFGILSQNAFQAFLGSLLQTNQSFTFTRQMILLDKVFAVFVWMVWLIMMVITEESLRRGVKAGGLFKRFARFAAPLILLIFFSDVALLAFQGFASAPVIRWILLALELVLAVALAIYGQLPRRLRVPGGVRDES